MREQLSDLRLNLETIELDRKFCEGLSLAYLRTADHTENQERRWTLRAFAATNFRRAGAHAILLDDPRSATKLFAAAAATYASLNMPYALMMFSLAGQVEEASRMAGRMRENDASAIHQGFPSLEKQSAYLWVFDAATTGLYPRQGPTLGPDLGPIKNKLGPFNSSVIGVLGLPAGCYVDLAEALADARGSSIEEALFPFVSVYNTAIRQAGLNRLHWSRLQMPFHPVEPDILGLLVLTHTALAKRPRKRSIVALLKKYPLSWASRAILHGALSQLLSLPRQ